ncbi:MAG TPA: BrnA antitoxin family protein [Candidatus Saccharimonadales bacterium]|nr:BrnA antitoxin family protein [Candidatus Saccharimonadales bacterium]
MSDLKQIPDFKDANEEAVFWDNHDSTEYVDWSQAKKTIFPNLKSSTESISLRLPSSLLARIKELANEKDVPYQSLMKVYLSDQVKRDLEITHK